MTSRGFGKPKVHAHNKEKIGIRKALRAIRHIAKGGKKREGILQEYRRLETAVETSENLPGSNQANGIASDAPVEREGAGSNQGDVIRIDSQGGFGSEARDTTSRCGNVEGSHRKEWDASFVDPDIIDLNVKSLSGSIAYDYLLYSPSLNRTNTGKLTTGLLNRYQHLDSGGWWSSGIDVLTGEDSLWGSFKPNNPLFDAEKQKSIKYELPPKVVTEIFALKVPHRLWQLVARRYDVALPDNYQELPHSAFWKWVMDHPQIPIIISEGAKKAAAVLSCGYVCIALPGVWNGVRQPKDERGDFDGVASLIPQLQVFAQAGRRIYFAFDQDSKRNTVRSVNKAIARTAKLFINQKCEVKILSWLAVLGKGIDDLLVAFGREKFDELYRSALTFDEWSSQQLRKLTYTPDLVINQRYFGEVAIPASAQLVGAIGPKGTGKTQLVEYLVGPQIRSGERKTLLISHRIQLALQTSTRLGIPFVTQLKDAQQGSLFGYALCIDSLHRESQARFIPQEWRGATVILDEVQQIIWHLLSSSTCTSKRVAIIKTLQELLQTVVNSGGKIIILDADLNDIAIDFIEGLLGFSPERFILVNEYKFQNPWTVYKFGGKNPSGMIAELEKRVSTGEKTLVCVSGQKAKSKWGSTILEEYFKRKYPHLRILRIDSESVANPEHEAFGCTENLNEIIVNYDLVIASPTVETGVSIDVEHFDGVWLIGQGVQTTDGVRQHLSRVRPAVPRYVWIKSVGINFVGNGSSTVAGLIASQKRLDKANRVKLIEAGLQELPDGNFSPICLETWAKLGAIINSGMWKYEETILKDLEEEGHHIVDWEDREIEDSGEEVILNPESLKEEITQVRDEVYQKYREDVSASSKLTDTEYEKLNKQQQRKTDELLQLRKGTIERKYLIDCSPELIEKDDNRWSTKIRLHYFWKDGREYLQFKDSQLVEKSINQGKGDYFCVDINKGAMQLKVNLLDYLGISRLYEDAGFHSNHPIVIEIIEKISATAKDIKEVAGIDLDKLSRNEKKRIDCLQTVLSLVGHKMVCYGRKGKRGEQVRYYSGPAAEFHRDPETKKLILGDDGLPVPMSDGREAVFDAWLQRDADLRQKVEQEKAAAQAAEAAWIEAERLQLNKLTEREAAKLAAAQAVEVNSIEIVDSAIREHDPMFRPETSDKCLMWQRRLNRAVMLGSEIARKVYTSLPQQLLNEVWNQLGHRVQMQYAELFAS